MRFMAILESFLSSLHLLINGTGKVGYATLRGALANEKGVCQSNFYLTDFSGWGCNFRGNAKCKMLSPFQESSALLTAFFFDHTLLPIGFSPQNWLAVFIHLHYFCRGCTMKM